MDYSKILQELEEASLFDLFRLNVAINDKLKNPQRIEKVKHSLMIGQEITWFNNGTNRLEKAVVRKLNPTRCEITNLSNAKNWNILYAAINMDIDANIIKEKKLEYEQWLKNNKGLLNSSHPDILEDIVGEIPLS